MSSIVKSIENINEGKIFTLKDLKWDNANSAVSSISRLVKLGRIKRYSKGKYYKPKKDIFGTRPLSYKDVAKFYLGDKTISGYYSGIYLYNYMGLTSQVPTVIEICTNKVKFPEKKNAGKMTIYLKPLEVNISSKSDVILLQYLDLVKNIKRAPDVEPDKVVDYLKQKLLRKNINFQNFINFASGYQPFVRATIGSILEVIGYKKYSNILACSLNPLTKYNLNISSEALPNKFDWNIV
ncbi:DUF6088 family protein [Flexistipes sp.]|uniref:DUF6088 family protein n=1 Tax=Flexistipes sp. TaxID=3088135 RepID=UPI002E1A6636|nr:DUF6088 family protein [Flexistipes sp.]